MQLDGLLKLKVIIGGLQAIWKMATLLFLT